MSTDTRSGHPHRTKRSPNILIFAISLIVLAMSVSLTGCGLEDSMPIVPSVTILPSRTILTPVFTPTATQTTPTQVPPTATLTTTPTVVVVEFGVVSVGAAYLRAGPAVQNRIVGYGYQGDQFLILDHSEDDMWLRIDYPEEAWISASLVEVTQLTATPVDLPEVTPTPEITTTVEVTTSPEITGTLTITPTDG